VSSLPEGVCEVMKSLWESLAPLKIKVFSWQLMWKRLPTRERGIIATDEDDVAFVPSSRERNGDSPSYMLPCGFCGLAWNLWLVGNGYGVAGSALLLFRHFRFSI
jgi:hypothetical protein